MTQAVEGMRCKWKMIGPGANTGHSTILTMKIPLAKLVGATPSRYMDDDRYSALVSANPSEAVGLHLFAYDATFATNVAVAWQLELTYESEFFDRIFPSQSFFKTRPEEEMKKIHPPQFLQCIKGIKTGQDATSKDFEYHPLPYDKPSTSSSSTQATVTWADLCDRYSVDDFDEAEIAADEEKEVVEMTFEEYKKALLKKRDQNRTQSKLNLSKVSPK